MIAWVRNTARYWVPILIIMAGTGMLVLNSLPRFRPPAPTLDGIRAMQENRIIDAIRSFSDAKKYCETDIEASSRLGHAYHEYGWADEALFEYENTYGLAVRNVVPAMWSAARLLREKGDLENAEIRYRRALLLAPGNHAVWRELGTLLEEMGRRESALGAYREVLRLNPDDVFARQACERLVAPRRMAE
jgi:Flp pilus assembly protein TadD